VSEGVEEDQQEDQPQIEEDLPRFMADISDEKLAKARDIAPPILFFGEEDTYDFLDLRPVQVESEREEEPPPKDLSAQESVDTSDSTDLEPSPEETAPVEKDSGQPKESESGPQTSSSKTPAGKKTQTAST
jgi:hypothetical protein